MCRCVLWVETNTADSQCQKGERTQESVRLEVSAAKEEVRRTSSAQMLAYSF